MSKETKKISIGDCGRAVALPSGRVTGVFVSVDGALRIIDRDGVLLNESGITIGDGTGRLVDSIQRAYGARPEFFVVLIEDEEEVKKVEAPVPIPELAVIASEKPAEKKSIPVVLKNRRGR